MEFEFGPAKGAANKLKHGIDLAEARRFGVSKEILIETWIMQKLEARAAVAEQCSCAIHGPTLSIPP